MKAVPVSAKRMARRPPAISNLRFCVLLQAQLSNSLRLCMLAPEPGVYLLETDLYLLFLGVPAARCQIFASRALLFFFLVCLAPPNNLFELCSEQSP